MSLIRPTDRRAPRSRRRAAIVVAVLVVLLALGWWLFEWNWFKGTIERRVEAATGREFSIGGTLDVDLGWTPTIRADAIALGNAAWSRDPRMFSAARLEFDIALWPLLRGEVVLPAVTLRRPRLVLERNADLAANWDFDGDNSAENEQSVEWPEVGALLIEDGELVVRDPRLATDLRLDVDSGTPRSEDTLAPLVIDGEGMYRDVPFTLDGRVESPLQLRDRERPYRVALDAKAGATEAHARGELYSPLQFHDFDVRFALAGEDLAALFPLLGIALPQTPPYTLDGRLLRDGSIWRYSDFTGTVGDSDLAGDATIDAGRERPMFTARLVSQRLDFDDLAGFVGLPPSSRQGETASPEQAERGAALAAQDKVLPQQPYRLDKLRAMDADVTLDAAQVSAPPLPIDALSGHLTLENGLAKLQPLTLQAAGGRIESFVSLDASRDPIVTDAQIALHGLQLPKLFPQAELVGNSSGRIGGRLALQGTGNSIARMLGSANGEVGLVMGRGRISNLLLELAGLDLAEALRFMLGRDRIIPVRCAHADFGVTDGVMQTRQFAFDTTDTVLYADGSVNLRDETLDLVLRPQPKDKSLVSLRSPLQVSGTFKAPSVRPQTGPLALRGIAAALLYSVAPPATLLALLETGPGEDSDCGQPAGSNDTGS